MQQLSYGLPYQYALTLQCLFALFTVLHCLPSDNILEGGVFKRETYTKLNAKDPEFFERGGLIDHMIFIQVFFPHSFFI